MSAVALREATDSTQWSHDYAEADKDALGVDRLEQWFQELRDEPNWRRESDIDADYYDGHQLDSETLELMRSKGFPAIIENLCRPTIDSVLGLEAKTRTDWVVRHDHDRWEDVAMALSVKLKEAERESKADKACSDAYAALVKTGAAWVEVGKEIVPGFYPYRCRYVHRREIGFDWRFKEPDGRDMRYLVRRQWFDTDVLTAMFPDHKDLIEAIGSNWTAWWDTIMMNQETGLARSYEIERATSIEALEFRDLFRKRLCLYEVWYRTWKSAAVLHLPDGRWVEYDKKNTEHVKAVALGLIKPEIRPLPKVRLSFWIGPHRLIDMPTPYKHQHFPYVPFFGYREDRTGVMYGLIRSMRHQQDEVNARKAKMMWMMSAKRVRADADAVLDHNKARQEVARPDAYIILNQNRKPLSKFEVDDNMQLSDQQFKVYQDAKQALQDVAGVYQALLGKESAANSGVAINSLIEQGTTTLAEINDNYRHSRRLVGELLLELVKEDVENGTTVMVGEGPQRREVTLNTPTKDEFGPYLANDVQKAGVKLVLDDIPATPTYRSQQLVQLTEITKSLPPQLQALIIDFVIEATDLPNRKAIAERLRQAQGINTNTKPRTPEEALAREQQAKDVAVQKDLQVGAAKADIAVKESKAIESRAKAEKTMAEAHAVGQDDGSGAVAASQADAQASDQRVSELEAQLKQVTVESSKVIEKLTAEVAKLRDTQRQQGDLQGRADDAIEKASLEAKISEQFNKLNLRIEKLAGDLKVVRATKTAAKRAPSKGA